MIKVIDNIDPEKDYVELKLNDVLFYVLFKDNKLVSYYGYENECKDYENAFIPEEEGNDEAAEALRRLSKKYSLLSLKEKDVEEYNKMYDNSRKIYDSENDYYNYLSEKKVSNKNLKYFEDYHHQHGYFYDEYEEEEEMEESPLIDKNILFKEHTIRLYYDTPYTFFPGVDIPYELYAIKDGNRALIKKEYQDYERFVGYFDDCIYLEDYDEVEDRYWGDIDGYYKILNYYNDKIDCWNDNSILSDSIVLELFSQKLMDANQYLDNSWKRRINAPHPADDEAYISTYFIDQKSPDIYRIRVDTDDQLDECYIASFNVSIKKLPTREEIKQELEKQTDKIKKKRYSQKLVNNKNNEF